MPRLAGKLQQCDSPCAGPGVASVQLTGGCCDLVQLRELSLGKQAARLALQTHDDCCK